MLLFCAAFATINQADAADNTNPKIAEGSSFLIYVDGQGGVMFQHPDVSFFETQFLAVEVLSGTWNGTDCRLSMTKRGGSLYFESNSAAEVQFYSSGVFTFNIDGAEATRLSTTSYNSTFTDGALIQINWGFPLTLPHEPNFMFWIGLAGIIMLVCGIMLSAYAFRHYTIFTLEDKETIWDKDILPVCILLVLGGFCLLIAWLFSGA